MSDDRDDALERLLRLVPYFRDLDRVSLARLAGALEPIDVTAGTEITREGTESSHAIAIAVPFWQAMGLVGP